ncbi:MAG: SDR family oxidoreductase [Acidobacteriaceae bacterium]
METLRNHTIVITGASSGFGQGAALKFAKAGANLVLAARREKLLNEVAAQCRNSGGQAVVIKADVSDPGDVRDLAAKALSEFGRIDVWINNAGVGTVGKFEQSPIEEHEQVIRTNLLGTMYGSYEALRAFHEQGRGALINVGSFAGEVGSPYLSSYAASKFGIRGLDMALRQELKQNGEREIHVCTIEPVSMDTPFFGHAANHTGKPVKPLGKVYDPEEVIEAIFEAALHPEDNVKVIVGASGKAAAFQHRLTPELVENQLGKMTHKTQMGQQGTAPNSSGSLFTPSAGGRDVYGGWKSKGPSVAKYLGFAIPTALLWLLVAKRRSGMQRSEAVDRAA